jgi:hypothetical protein
MFNYLLPKRVVRLRDAKRDEAIERSMRHHGDTIYRGEYINPAEFTRGVNETEDLVELINNYVV